MAQKSSFLGNKLLKLSDMKILLVNSQSISSKLSNFK